MWISSSRANQLREHVVILVLLAFYVSVTVQQRNPIDNFCRRWGHQTTVVDNKLFIDGGLITFNPAPQTPENISSTFYLDCAWLGRWWDWRLRWN